MALKESERNYISASGDASVHHGNRKFIKKLSSKVNREEMNEKKQKIYWHKKGIKIDFDLWEESEETNRSISPCNLGICTPGPKAEPPFEVEVVYSLFQFTEGKESSIYAIKIASLSTSWIILKKIDEIIALISEIREKVHTLSRLNIKNIISISPKKQEERYALIKIILASILNSKILQKDIQNFILTDAFSIEEVETFGLESIISEIFGSLNGVYLVEYKGWISGWRCGYFQLQKNLLIRTSARSGKVTEIIDIEKVSISISGRTLTVKDAERERFFVANDKNSFLTLKSWFKNSANQCSS